jgi:hypothetical protein
LERSGDPCLKAQQGEARAKLRPPFILGVRASRVAWRPSEGAALGFGGATQG